jgi:uncharacterized membrane protein
MTNKHSEEVIHHGNGSLMAIFAYLGILIVIPFLAGSYKDPFVKFHIKQGFALIIFDVIGWIVALLIGWIAVIGGLITSIWGVVSIILVIVGIINVLQSTEKELPLIGKYGDSFKF